MISSGKRQNLGTAYFQKKNISRNHRSARRLYHTMAQKIILSKTARPELASYIEGLGYEVEPFGPIDHVQEPLRCHPDMLLCRLDRDTVFKGEPARLSPAYPGDIIYNACSTGKFFIHNLKYTAPELLAAADEMGLIRLNVSQGYAKCSTCVVREDAIITYDRGIAGAAAAAGLEVLVIRPGYVELPGYNTGFIGGASGLVRDLSRDAAEPTPNSRDAAEPTQDPSDAAEPTPNPREAAELTQDPCTKIDPAGGRIPRPILVFNGDLSAHPDFRAITDFAEEHGAEVKFFADWKLTDIGSII